MVFNIFESPNFEKKALEFFQESGQIPKDFDSKFFNDDGLLYKIEVDSKGRSESAFLLKDGKWVRLPAGTIVDIELEGTPISDPRPNIKVPTMKTFITYLKGEVTLWDLPWNTPFKFRRWGFLPIGFIFGFLKHIHDESIFTMLLGGVLWYMFVMFVLFIRYKLVKYFD